MKLLNEKVKHKIFGDGVVTGVSPKRIEVSFPESNEVKLFQYPDSFEKYLKIADKTKQKDILTELKEKNKGIKLKNAKIKKEFDKAVLVQRNLDIKPPKKTKSK